jgi:hypothetical protein
VCSIDATRHLISDALRFGRLGSGEPNSISNPRSLRKENAKALTRQSSKSSVNFSCFRELRSAASVERGVKWQAAVSVQRGVKWKAPAEHVRKGNGTATKKKEAADESEKLTF